MALPEGFTQYIGGAAPAYNPQHVPTYAEFLTMRGVDVSEMSPIELQRRGQYDDDYTAYVQSVSPQQSVQVGNATYSPLQGYDGSGVQGYQDQFRKYGLPTDQIIFDQYGNPYTNSAILSNLSSQTHGNDFQEWWNHGPNFIAAAYGAGAGLAGLGVQGTVEGLGTAAANTGTDIAGSIATQGIGDAPGIGGTFMNVGSTAEGVAEGGAALGSGLDGSSALLDTGSGLGTWSMGTGGALGMTPAEIAAIQGAFPMTAGIGGAGLAAATASGLGGASSFADMLQGAPYVPGEEGPFQPGYNVLDPSTYGTNSSFMDVLKSGGEAAAKLLKEMFPQATTGSALLGAGQALLGYLGAQKQAEAIKNAQGVQNQAIQKSIDFAREQSDKFLGLGQPYRDRLNATYAPGYSIWDDSATRDAAKQAADISARSYSAKAGNPFDQPASQGGIYRDVLQQVALPQLNKTRDQLGTFGQLGTSQAGTFGGSAVSGLANLGNNAAAGVATSGAGLDAIGAGLKTALQPPLSIQDLSKIFATNYQLKV